MTDTFVGVTAWTRRLETSLGIGEHHTLAAQNIDAIEKCGAGAVVLPTQNPANALGVVQRLDALVVSGGGDVGPSCYAEENIRSADVDMARDQWEIALVHAARATATPVLGICRGIQIVNVAFGGTLHQHVWGTQAHPELVIDKDKRIQGIDHAIEIVPGTYLAEIYDYRELVVNSYHHQGLAKLGTGLTVSATAPDGGIEAVEVTDGPLLAVQWHPELLDEPHHQPLIEWLLRQV